MQMGVYSASERFVTRAPERVTHHSFSFGEFYDPANLGFGPLLAFNDDHLGRGAGYPDHPHRDLEIVTWVLEGALVHTDSLGHRSVLPAGTVQVQSAGSGIVHSEVADPGPARTRFVQAWLRPDHPGTPPARFTEIGLGVSGLGGSGLGQSGLAAVAGAGAPLPLDVAGATFWVGRLAAGSTHALPAGSRHHVFAATGAVLLEGGGLEGGRLEGGRPEGARLAAGDAARLSDVGGLRVSVESDAELLVWTLPREH